MGTTKGVKVELMGQRQEAEAAVQRFENRNRVDSEFTAILVIYHPLVQVQLI